MMRAFAMLALRKTVLCFFMSGLFRTDTCCLILTHVTSSASNKMTSFFYMEHLLFLEIYGLFPSHSTEIYQFVSYSLLGIEDH